MANSTYDTKDLYVCVYDGDSVGVFRRKEYGYYLGYFSKISGWIYKDLLSEQIGIYGCFKGEDVEEPMEWKEIGYTAYIETATCNMNRAVAFESIRLALKRDRKLDIREPGKATLSEIYEVLELAPEYLGLTQEIEKRKEKL